MNCYNLHYYKSNDRCGAGTQNGVYKRGRASEDDLNSKQQQHNNAHSITADLDSIGNLGIEEARAISEEGDRVSK